MIFQVTEKIQVACFAKSRLQKIWKVVDEILLRNTMKQERQQECYGQVEIKNAGQRVTIDTLHVHAKKILEVRRHGPDDEAGGREISRPKKWNNSCAMRKRKRHAQSLSPTGILLLRKIMPITKQTAATPIGYQSPLNGSPLSATSLVAMKGVSPPKIPLPI